MHTLVYHTGALGDFITTLPALEAFVRIHGQSRLLLLGKREHGILGVATNHLSSFVDIEQARFASLFTKVPRFERMPEIASAEAAIVFATEESPVVHNLRKLPLRSLYHQPPFPNQVSPPVHIVDYHLSLFDTTALHGTHIAPSLVAQEQDLPGKQLVNECAGPGTMVIHAGSGSPSKNWPFARFVEVASMVRGLGGSVIWTAGPAERDLAVPGEDRLVVEPSLVELVRILSRAGLYLGNDSGVSHLAAAVGCPSVVLFGPSDAALWGPRGRCVHVMRAPGGTIADLPVAPVRQACLATAGWGVGADLVQRVTTEFRTPRGGRSCARHAVD